MHARRRKILLDAKDDNLTKHQGWKKAKKDLALIGVKKDEYYWDKFCRQKWGKRVLAIMQPTSIVTLVAKS